MNFLGAITTDVWPKHNQVRAVSVHIFLVKVAVENFDVATTTVNLLFMFYSKLNDQSLALVAELIEFCRDSIEPGILGSLETLNVKKKYSIKSITYMNLAFLHLISFIFGSIKYYNISYQVIGLYLFLNIFYGTLFLQSDYTYLYLSLGHYKIFQHSA